MSSISNPASPGRATNVVAETPIRALLAGFIPFTNHGSHPAVTGPIGSDAHVRPVPQAVVDAAGGPTLRRQ
jgi:hypothetical protein